MFDRGLVIRRAGTAISRVLPQVGRNCVLTDVVEMVSRNPFCQTHFAPVRLTRSPLDSDQVRPHMEISFDNILHHINTIYVLRTREAVIAAEFLSPEVLQTDHSLMRLKVRK